MPESNPTVAIKCPEASRHVSAGVDGNVPQRPGASPGVLPRPAVSRPHEICRTNPTVILTGRQLAAARLVADGLPTLDVAGELKTTARTVNRWKERPDFQAEVRRVHELMAIQRAKGRPHPQPAQRLFSPGRSAADYPSARAVDRPPAKSIEQENLEVEAMISQLLGETPRGNSPR